MRVKQNKHKPIIFGNCKEVLATVIMFYFAANLVFGAEENETVFCRRGWSEFVNDRKKWENECLNEDVRASLCCKATAGYLEQRYEDYIKWCPIVEGRCECHYYTEREVSRIVFDKKSIQLSWSKPNLICPHKYLLIRQKVEPNIKSPHKFSIGRHEINNTFELYGGIEGKCTIVFNVRFCPSQECRKNWKEHGNSCYLFVIPTSRISRMSWEDSRANCLKHGADLVSILNSSEVDFINKQRKALGGGHRFWIGLFRNTTTSDPKKEGWAWSDGNTFTNPQQWLRDEPNNFQNNEKCAELYARNKQWNDNNCFKLSSSICKRKKASQECPKSWKEYGYFCYLFVIPTLRIGRTMSMSWEDARANCLGHGADLVSILNSAEVDFINKQTKALGGGYRFWIGLFRNKTTSDPKEDWTWSDGNTFTNPQQWMWGEPNFYNEHCAELFARNKQWNNNNCAKLFSSICKRKKDYCSCESEYEDHCWKPAVRWNKPCPVCTSTKNGLEVKEQLSPNIRPPAALGVGEHTINYTFTYNLSSGGSRETKCSAKIRVYAGNDSESRKSPQWEIPTILPPGECWCSGGITAKAFVLQGGKSVINWEIPTLKCVSDRLVIIRSQDVQPHCVSPPSEFGVGNHTVTYTYGYLSGTNVVKQQCPIEINITACQCPHGVVRVNAEIDGGSNTTFVSWTIPKPNCPVTLSSVSPPEARNGKGRYPIGKYDVSYNYEHSSASGSFALSCLVEITIKG